MNALKLIFLFSFLSGCVTMTVHEECMQQNAPQRYSSYEDCVQKVQARRQQGMAALSAYGQSLTTPREPTPQQKQLDLNCMKDCRAAGYSYNLCESKCSYYP